MVYEVEVTSRDLKHYPHFDAPIFHFGDSISSQ